jgi:hypothetical protein
VTSAIFFVSFRSMVKVLWLSAHATEGDGGRRNAVDNV